MGNNKNSKRNVSKKSSLGRKSSDQKENRVKKVKINKPNPDDSIELSQELMMRRKSAQNSRRRARPQTKSDSRTLPNGKPMPSLADLERLYNDSDEDTPEQTTRTSAPDILLSPNTRARILDQAKELLHLSNKKPCSSDTALYPSSSPPLKRQKLSDDGTGYKKKIFIDTNYDPVTPLTFDESIEDILKSCSIPIKDNKNEEKFVHNDGNLSDSDSNKTIEYNLGASTLQNEIVSQIFSPLPSTSKDSQTFLKNDELFQKSLDETNINLPTEIKPKSETVDSPGEAVTPVGGTVEAVTAVDGPGEAVTTVDSPGEAITPVGGPGEAVTTIDCPGKAVTTADSPGEAVTPVGGPGEAVTPIGGPGEAITTVDSPEEAVRIDNEVVLTEHSTNVKEGETDIYIKFKESKFLNESNNVVIDTITIDDDDDDCVVAESHTNTSKQEPKKQSKEIEVIDLDYDFSDTDISYVDMKDEIIDVDAIFAENQLMRDKYQISDKKDTNDKNTVVHINISGISKITPATNSEPEIQNQTVNEPEVSNQTPVPLTNELSNNTQGVVDLSDIISDVEPSNNTSTSNQSNTSNFISQQVTKFFNDIFPNISSSPVLNHATSFFGSEFFASIIPRHILENTRIRAGPQISAPSQVTAQPRKPKKKKNAPKEKEQVQNTSPKPSGNLGDCPICMDTLSVKVIASTICGHLFCMSCIKQAIKSNKRCPSCRKILKNNGYHQIYL